MEHIKGTEDIMDMDMECNKGTEEIMDMECNKVTADMEDTV